jgi:hypothetical protein
MKEEPRFRPIDPILSPLLCPGEIFKLDKPLVVGRSLWTTNPVFP